MCVRAYAYECVVLKRAEKHWFRNGFLLFPQNGPCAMPSMPWKVKSDEKDARKNAR